MKRLIAKWTTVFVLATSTVSAWQYKKLDFDLGYAWRSDSLNWNIADVDGSPNVLSELIWKDLYINQVSAYFNYVSCGNFCWRGYADYGRLYHGSNTDTDYFGDFRTIPISESKNNASKGEVFDMSIGFGYQLELGTKCVQLTPLFGYSWHEQHLRIYDGEQVLGTMFAPLGPIEGLHSDYKARWHGWWVGADLNYDINCEWSVFGTIEGHWAIYKGIGNWNLRRDFLGDFTHKAHGQGVLSAVGARYNFCSNWRASLVAGYQTWKAEHGKASVVLDIGDEAGVPVTAPFNNVNWHSFTLTTSVGYDF